MTKFLPLAQAQGLYLMKDLYPTHCTRLDGAETVKETLLLNLTHKEQK